MRENDYIVASINNPNFTNGDFQDVLGMNGNNTQILSKDQYLKSSFITNNPAFQDDKGNFQQQKFDDFYKQKVGEFNQFSGKIKEDNYYYSMFDTDAPANAKIKNGNFSFQTVTNPTKQSMGIIGRNMEGPQEFTNQELAQQSNIFDTETGKFLDKTANDLSLTKNPIGWFKSLFSDPLVYATWDSEGYHIDPNTKQKVHHQAGDFKINNAGEYYTETLNGRSLANKQVVSKTDLLTIDNEGINKYDFFDSDSSDKSIPGIIAKSAVQLAPLFMGPVVAPIYSGGLVFRELAKTLPMLNSMIGGLFGEPKDNKTLNTIAGMAESLTSGSSEYAKQHTFALENFANLATDVALQWGQQKAIANGISKLQNNKGLLEQAQQRAAAEYMITSVAMKQKEIEGTLDATYNMASYLGDPKKWYESALGKSLIQKYVNPVQDILQKQARLGADMSLAYMSLISNTDVYQTLLEKGANKHDAAIVALGSTIGMFGVDKYTHIGELFFDDLTGDIQNAIRNAFKKEAHTWKDSLTQIIKNPQHSSKNKIMQLIDTGKTIGKNATNNFLEDLKYHTTSAVEKAVGEGLEEVSEELVADMSKQLYQWAGSLGPNFLNQSGIKDVGAWENAMERYSMNFLGGAMGGGIFYGVDTYNGNITSRNTDKDQLMYLIRNGHRDTILSELESWKNKGKLGSTNLSSSKFEEDSEGNKVYLTTDDKSDSQNDFIYNRIKEEVNQLTNIINDNGANLSDDQLFDKMVLGEARFEQLKETLKDQAYSTGYQQQFQNIISNLIDAQSDLKNALKTKTGNPNDVNDPGQILPDSSTKQGSYLQDPSRQQNIQKLQDRVDSLTAERDAFLNGEKSLDYTRRMLFNMDAGLHAPFISMTFEEWVYNNKGGKELDQLSNSEKIQYKNEYLEYKRSQQKEESAKAFEKFKAVEAQIIPLMQELVEKSKLFKGTKEILDQLDNDERSPLNVQPYNWDSKLNGESDEQYNSRDSLLEGETEEDFAERRANRLFTLQQMNQELAKNTSQKILDILDKTGGMIDSITSRRIRARLRTRLSDIANNTLEYNVNSFLNNSDLQEDQKERIKSIFLELKPDLSNISEVSDSIQKYFNDNVNKILTDENTDNSKKQDVVGNILKYFSDNLGYDNYDENNISTQDLSNLINYLANTIVNADEDTKQEIAELFDFEYDEDDDSTELYKLMHAKNVQEAIDILKNTQADSDEDYPVLFSPEMLIFSDKHSEDNIIQKLHDDLNDLDEAQENKEYKTKSDEEISKEQESKVSELMADIKNTLTNIKNDIDDSVNYKVLKNAQDYVKDINPVAQLLKAFTLKLNPEDKNLEALLEYIIQKRESGDNVDSFELGSKQIESLDEAANIIEMLQAYLYATATEANFGNPIGHNKSINEFAKNHSDVYSKFEPLPELDSDTANMLIQGLQEYKNEIEQWKAISDANKINKTEKFNRADVKFNKIKLEFFNGNRDAFKFTIDGNEVDLLEGIEDIDTSNSSKSAIYINDIENLYYNNLKKLLDQGYSFEEILEKSQLLENIVNGDLGDIVQQHTMQLDDNIKYSDFTSFDKMVYLFTISALKSNDFNYFVQQQLNDETSKNIVPLTIQEYASRVAIAKIIGKNIINDGFKYLNKQLTTKLPILENFIFIDGVAGAGKTKVIIGNVIKYTDSKNIWLSAPKPQQQENLKSTLNTGEIKSRQELFNSIIDPETYSEILHELDSPKSNDNKYITQEVEQGSPVSILKRGVIKYNTDNAPELIVIDEVTHFSTIELQLLNEFAESTGTQIIGLGDSNQNGYNKKGTLNIDRETMLITRTPKLSISLRDVNTQKQDNLNILITLANKLQSIDGLDSEPKNAEIIRQISQDIKNISLKLYNGDEIRGDMITNSLTTDTIKKLQDSTVGFVGSETSTAYKELKNNGINVTRFNNAEEVQGAEFDYIIVDKDWKIPTNDSSFGLLQLLQDVYTMISRGRSGSILIDNGLTKYINKNTIETHSEIAPSLLEAAEKFRNSRKELLDQMGLEEPQSQTSETQSTQSSEQIPKLKIGDYIQIYNDDGSVKGIYNIKDISDGKYTLVDSEGNEVEYDVNQIDSDLGNKYKQTTGFTNIKEPDDDENPPIQETDTNVTIPDEKPIPKKDVAPAIQSALGGSENNSVGELQNNQKKAEILDTKTNIRIYGANHLSGLSRTKVTNEDGTTSIIWNNPYVDSQTKRDLGIFTKLPQIITGQEKSSLVKKLLDFKSAILYKHSYEDLPLELKDLITKQEFDSIEFQVEVRPYDEEHDSFIGYSGLVTDSVDESGNTIKGGSMALRDNLIFNLVAKFKTGTIENILTLGQLARPETWEQSFTEGNIDYININNEIDQATKNGDTDKVSSLQKLRDKIIPEEIQKYKQLVNGLHSRYLKTSQGNPMYLKVNPQLSGLTYLRRKSQGKMIQSTPLVHYDELLDVKSNNKGWLYKHPYVQHSDVYIYTGGIPGVKDNSHVTAHGVMFVSGDTLLKKEDLLNQYIQQKRETERLAETGKTPNPFTLQTVVPSVRMLVLDNRGVSFTSLYKSSYANILKSETVNKGSDKETVRINMFPFETQPMSFRWLISLWNFRANLKAYNQKLTQFLNQNKDTYSEKDLLNAARANDDFYEIVQQNQQNKTGFAEGDEQSAKQTIATKYGTTVEAMNLVDEFNNSLAESVRQFRFGNPRSGKGRYIRKLTNITDGNSFYKPTKEGIFGIYLTPEISRKYEDLISNLFTDVINPVVQLSKTTYDPTTNSNISKPLSETTIISPNKDKANSLSGFITELKTSNNTITTEDEDGTQYTLHFSGENSAIRSIPSSIIDLCKSALRQFAADSQGEGYDRISYNRTISYQNIDGTTVEKTIKYNNILNKLERANGRSLDTTLFDMFSLAFHGTTSDIMTETQDSKKLSPRATDAYFKNGFYIDPTMGVSKNDHNVVTDPKTGEAILLPCSTNLALFTTDVDVDMPVFDIKLADLSESAQNLDTKKQTKPTSLDDIFTEEEADNLYMLMYAAGWSKENISEYIEELLNGESVDPQQIQYAIISEINADLEAKTNAAFKNNSLTLDTVMPIEDTFAPKLQTFREYINDQLKNNNIKGVIDNNSSINWDNGNLIVSLQGNPNSEIIISKNADGSFKFTPREIVDLDSEVDQKQSELEYRKNRINEFNSFIKSYRATILDPDAIEYIDSITKNQTYKDLLNINNYSTEEGIKQLRLNYANNESIQDDLDSLEIYDEDNKLRNELDKLLTDLISCSNI